MSAIASLTSLRAQHESIAELRDIPRYTFAEAARYLDMPNATVRAWTVGCNYTGGSFEPVITPASYEAPNLSFNNLIEIFTLRALRRSHFIKMARVRDAIAYTERKYQISRLLLSEELCAGPGRMILDRLGEVEEVSAPGQGVMGEMLAAHLERLAWDGEGLPEKIYPPTRENLSASPKVITIVPTISFGRPIIDGTGIKASVIARRFEAGDSIRMLCSDFHLRNSQVEEAVRWSQRAAA